MNKELEITLIGGGTGSFTLLQELKKLTPKINAVVNMSDDGGSTGILRDELGVLPPGDIRQCLVALSDTAEIRDLFSYRFSDGRFDGQSLGNIVLSGLELQTGSFDQALKVASRILAIKGQVIPVTLTNHILVMQDGDEVTEGEHKIGKEPINNRDAKLWLKPNARINPEAEQAILRSDIVVIAPGNLFGSILPALAVDGLREAIEKTKAKVVSVTNLVTKPGQTDDWHVVDYVKELEKYVGQGQTDVVLYNNQPPSEDLIKKYAADGEYPVATDADRFAEISAKSVGSALVADEIFKQDKNDKAIPRTLIRHDAKRVAGELAGLV